MPSPRCCARGADCGPSGTPHRASTRSTSSADDAALASAAPCGRRCAVGGERVRRPAHRRGGGHRPGRRLHERAAAACRGTRRRCASSTATARRRRSSSTRRPACGTGPSAAGERSATASRSRRPGAPSSGDAIVGLNGIPPRHLGFAQCRVLGAVALDLCLVAAGVLDGVRRLRRRRARRVGLRRRHADLPRGRRVAIADAFDRDLVAARATTRGAPRSRRRRPSCTPPSSRRVARSPHRPPDRCGVTDRYGPSVPVPDVRP